MNSLITILWYTAWCIAIPAFLIAWLATVGIVFRGFKSVATSNDGMLNALKRFSKQETINGQPQNGTGSKLSAVQVRNRGMAVFILCFIVILLININGLAPV